MDMLEAFLEIRSRRPTAVPTRRLRVKADDGADLLAGLLEPSPLEVREVLLFYHGAGGHMGTGYFDLARGIFDCCRTAVVLPDIRGHGRSSGPRGEVSCRERIWLDVDLVVRAVVERYPNARLHLGGHSLGASLCLNWIGRSCEKSRVCSIILVAPYTGEESVNRAPREGIAPFVCRGDIGSRDVVDGAGVSLSYPHELARAAGLVCKYSTEMFAALAPVAFVQQLRCITIPVSVIAARDDELFCSHAMESVVNGTGTTRFALVNGGHLTCLYFAHVAVCQSLAILQQ